MEIIIFYKKYCRLPGKNENDACAKVAVAGIFQFVFQVVVNNGVI